MGNDYDYGIRSFLLDDGKILVGSHSYFGTQPLRYEVVIAQLNADGSFDSNYGTDGKTKIRWTENGENYLNDMVLQDDGKLILAGRNSDASGDYFSMAKLDENGTLDTSFGVDGKVSGNIGNTADTATSIALQPDGKVVITGYTTNFSDPTQFFIARYSNETLSVDDFAKADYIFIQILQQKKSTWNGIMQNSQKLFMKFLIAPDEEFLLLLKPATQKPSLFQT